MAVDEQHEALCCGNCRHYHAGAPNPWSSEPMDDGCCAYFSQRQLVPFWSRAYTVRSAQGSDCKTWERKR